MKQCEAGAKDGHFLELLTISTPMNSIGGVVDVTRRPGTAAGYHRCMWPPMQACCAQEGLPGGGESDSVQSQVQRLIMQAESHENLCQSYIGWCPFW